MSDLVMVVPVYNEASRLDPGPWLQFVAADASRALRFVDDGSSDGTSAVLEALRAAAPDQIRVVRLAANRGKGEAVRAGMLTALADTSKYAGFIDADLAAPLTEVALLQAELDGHPAAWAAFGSRVKLLGRGIKRSERRHYLGRVFATCASIALSLPVYDTQCGLKLFRNIPQVQAAFAAPFRSRWIFDVELLARLAALAGGRIAERVREVPLEHWEERGSSRLGLKDFLSAPFELARIKRHRGDP
ncbi:MAG: glycosyltransferase [Gemmatimonadales bacterium]